MYESLCVREWRSVRARESASERAREGGIDQMPLLSAWEGECGVALVASTVSDGGQFGAGGAALRLCLVDGGGSNISFCGARVCRV